MMSTDIRLFHISLLLLVLITGLFPFPVSGEIQVLIPESLSGSDEKDSLSVHADFIGAPDSGRIPLMVQFMDLSRGNPVSWNWDFGDTYSSHDENPIHTYTQGGIYTVYLTVTGQDGSNDTIVKEGSITAHPLPLVANFSAEPGSGIAPLTVQFRDSSTGAMTRLWNFGDGTRESMLPDPSHTFQEPGTYEVRLSVSNELGETAVHQDDIDVLPSQNLTADFTGSPRSGQTPLTVQFTDKSQGDVASRSWNFGDGSMETEKNPLHTYTRQGVYPVSLTIYSSGGSSDSERKEDYIRVNDTLVSGSILLSPGWNFVSVPGLLASGNDTAQIFQHIDSGGHSAFRYRPEKDGWVTLNYMDPIRPLEAYWLYSTKNDEVPIRLDPGTVPSRMLLKGWNAVGFIGMSPVEAKQAFNSVKNTWLYCIGFNRVIQRYDEMISKGVNDDTLLDPYHGYWIFMSDTGIIE